MQTNIFKIRVCISNLQTNF